MEATKEPTVYPDLATRIYRTRNLEDALDFIYGTVVRICGADVADDVHERYQELWAEGHLR